MMVKSAVINNPMARYPEVRGTRSLGLDAVTATATHAETDGVLDVQVSRYAEVRRVGSPTLRKSATSDSQAER